MNFDALNGTDLTSIDNLSYNNFTVKFNKSQLKESENFDLKNNISNININNVDSSYDLINENQINYDNGIENNNATNFVNKAGSIIINAADLNQPEFHGETKNFQNEAINLKDLNSKVRNDRVQVREKSKNVLFLCFKKLICLLVGITEKTSNASLVKKKPLIEMIKNRSFLAFFFFGLTVILGILYAFLNIWFAITNGSSQASKNSILREFTSISVSLIWLLLGNKINFKKV